MSEEESTTDWAQLVCLTDAETPPFLIGKDKFTIGRAKGCDIAHDNNKLVSGIHCYILRDDSGKVWLYDTSTNGTLLNTSIKLTKGQCKEIEHGDEFYVVHKKGEEDVNIGYVYQDLEKLKEEEANDSGDLEQTLEYEDEALQVDATLADDSINQVDEELRAAVKRKPPPSEMGPGPSSKKPRAGQSREDSNAATDSSKNIPQTASKQGQGKEEETEKGGGEKIKGKKGKRTEEVKGAEKDEKEEEKGGEKVKKDEEKGGNDKMEEEKGGEKDKKEEEKVASKSAGKSGAGEEDAIAETLTCIICQEILHDCISLQPCMHSFCSGCYSEWMAHSKECPSCRGNVDRINKNHIVNNLVEAYLKEHPDKKRPEEDIKELDAKNKVTRDMLYQKIEKDSSEYEDSDAPPDEDEDEEDDQPANYPPPAPGFGQVFGFGTPFFGATTNAFRAICRQCPQAGSQATSIFGAAVNKIKTIFTGDQSKPAQTTPVAATTSTTSATPSTSGNNNNNNNNNNDTNNNTDQPGTSGAGPSGAEEEEDHRARDRKTLPDAPDYTCSAQQNHVMCQCCLQIFPDRRLQRATQPQIPPQQCTICFRAYCHAYWGCHKADCNGCLAKLKDMNFGRKVLPSLILENPSESDIFTRYLDSKKIALRDVLENCLAKLEEGSYSCPDQLRFTITGETPLCYACALRNFKVLAYQYRADIPNDQLPVEAKNRSDCYWGKECRTQRNKPAHAMRFNHVCEQTRT